MDAPSTSTDNMGPAKRTLPSRTRRPTAATIGGDVDTMILEAARLKESDALMEATQLFMGSTDSMDAETSMDADRIVNDVVNDRYFNKPEAIRSYREQLTIQTPIFSNLNDAPVATTRTRLKTSIEQPPFDTGDPAYERRHKKYDVFEKRLKAREKEKLQHDHYKLKERIEQLRALDSSAFLPLPASLFPPIPGLHPDLDYTGLPGASVNANMALNEGERRREEMLKTAMSLEERYRQLLPPERVPKKGPKTTESLQHSEYEPLQDPLPFKAKTSKSTAPTRSPSSSVPSATPVPSKKSKSGPKESAPAKSRKRLVIGMATPPPLPLPPVVHPSHDIKILVDAVHHHEEPVNIDRISNMRTVIHPSPSPQPSIPLETSPISMLPPPTTPVTHVSPRSSSIASSPLPIPPARVILPPDHPSNAFTLAHNDEVPDSISEAPPRKKSRRSKTPARPKTHSRAPSLPTIEALSEARLPFSSASPAPSPITPHLTTTTSKRSRPKTNKPRETVCMLVQAASHVIRNRGRHRARDAFGAKLPAILQEEYEYELPPYIHERETDPDETETEDGRQMMVYPTMTTMVGQDPDGLGESDEEVDQLDENAMREVEEQRLAMICRPPPATSSKQVAVANGNPMEVELMSPPRRRTSSTVPQKVEDEDFRMQVE